MSTEIEKEIEYIINTYHEPLPEFVEELNEKGYAFFYDIEDKYEEFNVKELKNNYFAFASRMMDHIIEEEEIEFPLLIQLYNGEKKEISESEKKIISKIVEEHSGFEEKFKNMEDKLLSLNVDESSKEYSAFKNLMNIFEKYKEESTKHIQAEVNLLEKVINKIGLQLT